jgi:energy-coupling factor transport system substrate-specific component
MMSLTPTWMFFAMIIMCLIGGTIGGLFGAKVLKKHFKKAGMA